MADKNIQMTQRNATNDGWDNLFPASKDTQIQITDPNNRFAGAKLDAVLEELFTFANDGKTAVADAVTAKGVSASPTDTFSVLAQKVGQIATGKKQAEGIAAFNSSSSLTITGLDFLPKVIGITSGLITSTGNGKAYIIKFFDDGKGGYSNRLLGYNMTDATGPIADSCTVSKVQGGFTVTMQTNLFANRSVNWFASE